MAFGITILTILISTVLYIIFRRPIRMLMMKSLAKRMNLNFNRIIKNYFDTNKRFWIDTGTYVHFYDLHIRNVIEGKYKNRDILIYEQITITSNTLDSQQSGTTKMLNIFVNGKNILSFNYNIFIWPPPQKIKKIIDDYIEKGIIPKMKYKRRILLFVFLIFIILTILILLLVFSSYE